MAPTSEANSLTQLSDSQQAGYMSPPLTSCSGHRAQPGSRNPLILVHCPTNRALKGTDLIIKAVRELLDEGYALRLHIVEHQPHEAVLRSIARADVVIDQLLIGWYGMVSIEAWALRKPVICYIRDDLWAEYNPPVCPADPSTIKDAIRELYNFPKTRAMWAKRGREYVERVHDISKVII